LKTSSDMMRKVYLESGNPKMTLMHTSRKQEKRYDTILSNCIKLLAANPIQLQTLALIPLFAKIDTSRDSDLLVESDEDFDFDRSLTVLGESKQLDITNRFKRESDAFYLEAKRSIVATTAKIPTWLIVLLIVLGWNEFMAILTSPIYLITFVFLVTAGYVVYALNLWGPLERVFSAVAGEATKMLREKVAEGVDRARDQGIELNAMKSFAGPSKTTTTSTREKDD
jgi:hypothetical protein